MAEASIHVRLLGPPVVSVDGAPVLLAPAPALLLAFLLLGPREGRTRSVIAAQLYGSCPEARARRRLSTILWRLRAQLREVLGQDLLLSAGPEVIAVDDSRGVRVDAREFEEALAPVLRVVPGSMTGDDAAVLAAAVDSYRGDLMEGCYDDWVLESRDGYSGLLMSALSHLVEFHAGRAELEWAERYARRALAIDPLREDIHRTLIAAYAGAGRRDLADRQFAQCAASLRSELGVPPMPETIELHARAAGRSPRQPTPADTIDLRAMIAELEEFRREVVRIHDRVTASLAALRNL